MRLCAYPALFALGLGAVGCASIPPNPEINSGPNQRYSSGDAITPADEYTGIVNYAQGNRTDWAILTLPGDGDLTIHMTNQPLTAQAKISAALYDGNGNLRGTITKADTPFKSCGVGDYYLEVWAPTHVDGGTYDFTFDFTPAGTAPTAAATPTYPPPPSFPALPAAPPPAPKQTYSGPSTPSRMHAQIIQVQRTGTFTQLVLNVGSADGVQQGWSGQVLDGSGSAIGGSDFTVSSTINPHSCIATSQVMPTALGSSRTVVLGH
jgi:hypothetical protein